MIEDFYAQECTCKGQTIPKAKYGFLNSSKKRTKLTILGKEDAQDSEFRPFFGRIPFEIYWPSQEVK